MKVKIHSTSHIHPKAILGEDVEVGPYTTIGKDVIIGKNTKIGEGVYIDEGTTIGENCNIFKGAVLGLPPQDFKYIGEKTFLNIGSGNTIREYVTIHRSTKKGTSTIIGNNNYLMAYSHVAHNCHLGDGIIMGNVASLAGHVDIEDGAMVGGLVGVHQFVKIGRLSIIGGCSKVVKDVIPYAKANGHPLRIYGVNIVGLKRNNFSEEVINSLKKVFKIIFRAGFNTSQALEKIKGEFSSHQEIKHIITFMENSKRGITK